MIETHRNRAFISYSQTDKLEARRLQRWLEAYRAPKILGGQRIGRIFRDETDLSGAADLGEALKKEINDSQALIVLCSPRAAKSEWVEREIQHFRATGRGEQIFAVILEGAPNSGNSETECFPPAFRATSGSEPLAVNHAADGRDRAFTRLAAGLLRAPFDALWQRERRRQRARAVFAGALTVVGLGLIAVAGAAAWMAAQNLERANQRAAQVVEIQSNLISRDAKTLFEGEHSDHTKSLLMALYADPIGKNPDVEPRLWPKQGYDSARARLAAAYSANRLQKVLRGHRSSVSSVAFSDDGKWIVTSSRDQTARIWNVETGDLVRTLEGHTSAVTAATFSPDSNWIVTGSDDDTARIWSVETGACLRVLEGHQDSVESAAFSPDGKWIVTGSADGTARVVDAQSGELLRALGGSTNPLSWGVSFAAFSPDGEWIMVGKNWTSTSPLVDVDLFSAATGNLVRSLTPYPGGSRSGAFSPVLNRDGEQLIVTGSTDGTARIWNAETGDFLPRRGNRTGSLEALEGHSRWINSVAFSHDGKRIVTGSGDGTARVWEALTGTSLLTLAGHGSEVTSAAFSPNGRMIVTGSADGTARIWKIDESGAAARTIVRHKSLVKSVSFAPASAPGMDRILTGGGRAKIWNANTAEEVQVFPNFPPGQQPSWLVSSTAFSPDGKWVLAGYQVGQALVWNAETGERGPLSKEPHSGHVVSVAWSPILNANGEQLVVTGSWDGTAQVWNAETGEPVARISGGRRILTSVNFSPDGKWIVTGSGTAAEIWSAETGELIRSLEGERGVATSAAFSPDGKRIVTGSGAIVDVWNAESGELIRSLEGHTGNVMSAAYSPDGEWIVTGSSDKSARIWDAETGDTVSVIDQHGGQVNSVAFSPGGKLIVTGSEDRTARIWAMPEILLAGASEQVAMACEMLANARAPLAFSKAEIAQHPVLEGQPVDPEDATMLLSPCKGVLSNEVFDVRR